MYITRNSKDVGRISVKLGQTFFLKLGTIRGTNEANN